jgi:8-amino-7-oxononanoate synthase
MEWLEKEIEQIEKQGRMRGLMAIQPTSAVTAEFNGQRIILFSSNDYLGLSFNQEVREAVELAVNRFGIGPRGASLICGYTTLHEELEEALAKLKGTETALLFPTGYMTNIGILQALGGEEVAIFSDELNHASIIDGCRLSRSKVHVYRHTDLNHLESLLRQSPSKRKLIVTDAVFSMDGDLAPLKELVDLKKRYDALLIVDEAHSTLIFGKDGSGLSHELEVQMEVDIQMGTLSKAVGSIGGFVALNQRLKTYLINRARSFIFTTALPLPAVAAALAAIKVATTDNHLRNALWNNIHYLEQRLNRKLYSPIVPIVIGEERRTIEIGQTLFQAGFHVGTVRPPTVAPGTSRLRITLSAIHTNGQVDALVTSVQTMFSSF